MFLVNVKEALGYTHEQTLDSSYALITGMLQEYAYMCNERNKLLYGDEEDEDYPFEWVELVNFTTGKTKRLTVYHHQAFFCAQNKTRTCTAVRPLVPETSVSTDSTTWALYLRTSDKKPCNSLLQGFSFLLSHKDSNLD